MDRANSFRALGNLLGSDMEVMSYDRRGYARSWQHDAPSIADHLEDLRALASAKPCIVFGHSFGGYLGLRLASEQLPSLRALAVFEAPLPASFWFPDWNIDVRAAARGDIPDELASEYAEDFLVRMVGKRVWDTLGPRTQEARRREGGAFVREVAELSLGEVPVDLSRIKVPCSVGVSQHAIDRQVLGGQELLRSLTRVTGYCIIGASHGAHLTHPRALAEDLLALSREVESQVLD